MSSKRSLTWWQWALVALTILATAALFIPVKTTAVLVDLPPPAKAN